MSVQILGCVSATRTRSARPRDNVLDRIDRDRQEPSPKGHQRFSEARCRDLDFRAARRTGDVQQAHVRQSRVILQTGDEAQRQTFIQAHMAGIEREDLQGALSARLQRSNVVRQFTKRLSPALNAERRCEQIPSHFPGDDRPSLEPCEPSPITLQDETLGRDAGSSRCVYLAQIRSYQSALPVPSHPYRGGCWPITLLCEIGSEVVHRRRRTPPPMNNARCAP